MLCVEPGEKLKLARRYHQPALRQHELATILKVDTSTVGRWESKNEIPRDKIPVLSGLFNIREDWWNNGDDTLPVEARKVPPHEPSNVQAKHPLELNKTEERMREGSAYTVPVWRGIAAGDDEECYFPDEPDFDPVEIPSYFITGNPEHFLLCIVKGMSMYPRIEHAERILIKLDTDVPVGNLVIARSPEGKNFVKRLIKNGAFLELHSVNDTAFQPIVKVDGWLIKGGVTVIWHNYEPGRPNIEWDEGRYLR